jgi:hypothetical protein
MTTYPHTDKLSVEDVFVGDRPLDKLLESLEEIFPLYIPTPEDSIAKIMYLAGQRSVVEYLKTKLET